MERQKVRSIFLLLLVVALLMATRLFQSSHAPPIAVGKSPAPAGPALPAPTAAVPASVNALPMDGNLWHSNHQVLCSVPSVSLMRQVVLLDTNTGRSTDLTAFNARWGDIYWSTSQTMQLSPDGKWLLWPGNKRMGAAGHIKPIWEAAALDGSAAWEWPRDDRVPYPKVAWSRDSRHWVEADEGYKIGGQTRLLYYTLGSPQVKPFPLPMPEFDVATGVWFTPSGHIIVTNAAGGAGGEGHMSNGFYEFALPQTDFPLKKYVIPVLPMSDVEECALSPDGTRLAWQLYIVRLIPRRDTLPGVLARLSGQQTRYTRSVWVSRLDGSNMHQVTPDAEAGSDTPQYVHWTPDGKRVSYWFQKALWTVPAI